MLLGCIADDFTGATDLANNLVRAGMRVTQTIGVPTADVDIESDAVVIALKSRTIEPREAIDQSLAALTWLRSHGARQIYFKVCSTFDSTDRGNIGPVTEALMDALACDFAIACPAFPENLRTVFNGHLFVGQTLLSDSGMRDHPLTPMTDSNLVRVLQRQSRRRVGLIDHLTVRAGEAAIRDRMRALRADGVGLGVVDAVCNADLEAMGRAFADLPLLTAGSGVAIGLPRNFGIAPGIEAARLPAPEGGRAIVSGSCSAASNAQVLHFMSHGGAGFAVDPLRAASGADIVGEALSWASPRLSRAEPVLIHATADAAVVKAVQDRLGVAGAGERVESILSAIARGLVQLGVGQLIVAGGETSGACVKALSIASMRIGPQIDPGVPWCHAASPRSSAGGLHLALKSGNFGTPDFFTKAFDQLA